MAQELVQELFDSATKMELSDKQLAQKLKLSQAYVSLIREGKRKLGVKAIAQIIYHFPHLSLSCMSYLKDSAVKS